MYLYNEDPMAPGLIERLDHAWASEVMAVFEGQLTCCARQHDGWTRCDKEFLRDAVLGLYADLVATQHRAADALKARRELAGNALRKMAFSPIVSPVLSKRNKVSALSTTFAPNDARSERTRCEESHATSTAPTPQSPRTAYESIGTHAAGATSQRLYDVFAQLSADRSRFFPRLYRPIFHDRVVNRERLLFDPALFPLVELCLQEPEYQILSLYTRNKPTSELTDFLLKAELMEDSNSQGLLTLSPDAVLKTPDDLETEHPSAWI